MFRIVFMGTPEFAVPTLERLIDSNGIDVVGVVTSVDKKGGRGRSKLLQSAVKSVALEQGIPVLQPRNLKSKDFIKQLNALSPDLMVVVAFRMLPEVVWSLPKFGTINLHGSLLPAYRGAAPINWAIIKGENQTGVTTFFIDREIDTGNILKQKEIEIGHDENAGSLHDRMMQIGADLVLETVRSIRDDNYVVSTQDESLVSKAPKIFRDDCRIDFMNPSSVVYNFIRGLSPYPGAWTTFQNQTLKVLGAKIAEERDLDPGKWKTDGRSFLYIGTSDQAISLLEVQLEGRRRMPVDTFLNGVNLAAEDNVLLVN